MTALELIALANQVLFIGLFAAVAWRALRDPSGTSLDIVLLFGSVAAIVIVGLVADRLDIAGEPWTVGISLLLLNLAPLAMLRLVADFSPTPRGMLVAAYVAFAAVAVFGFVGIASAERLYEIVTIAWFLGVGGYAAYAFGIAATQARGITRRRMTAVFMGALLFIGAIVSIFIDALVEPPDLAIAGQILALAAVVSFFLGFAPPAWIRRAWREPELRRFLQRSMQLAWVADERRMVLELQNAAAEAFGAGGASIGIAVPERRLLRYATRDGSWVEHPDDAFIAGRAFTEQRRIFVHDAGAADPEHAEVYQRSEAESVISSPITADDRRLGVISIYAQRASIFVEDDLWLLELLADQVGVLLESRALAEVEHAVTAREEAARLKEEFLSAAAHDLRTPLTVVLGQAELLERRVERDPNAAVDAAGIARLAREARRLGELVTQLLDAQRLEQGVAAIDPVPADLRDVVTDVRDDLHERGLDIRTRVPDEPVASRIDAPRIAQVLHNLVDNAMKYTSDNVLPDVELEVVDGDARLAVVDHGLGVPDEERDRIFERFYRASNVQSITDTGIGLGLYICRRVVDAHGGRIWVEATPGGGSTFVVSLSLVPSDAPEAEPDVPPTVSGAEALGDA
ncbi:MAG TPA: ATP-binding protein [Candidatus Limnocylindria bacterium]|nr:ATP-binding protein [Candidatus Limnocylindria bacterium]